MIDILIVIAMTVVMLTSWDKQPNDKSRCGGSGERGEGERVTKPSKKASQPEQINPAEFEEMCHCGHVLDEHEGPADPCAIEGCDCIAYEEAAD